MLWGAIIGDIVGSVYEFSNIRTKNFQLMTDRNHITDDTCMTIAVANALLHAITRKSDVQDATIRSMRLIGRRFPDMGYGFGFRHWLESAVPEPYNSWGNGSAMRVSAVGWVGQDLNQVKHLSYMVTSVTHNHIEGIKGAEATSVAVFLARTGHSKEAIANYIHENYYPSCPSVDELRDTYDWDVSCQGTVPQALQCFFESTSFEDTLRNAISIGGDSDTIGAIAGAVAGAYYGVPQQLQDMARSYVPSELLALVDKFHDWMSNKDTSIGE